MTQKNGGEKPMAGVGNQAAGNGARLYSYGEVFGILKNAFRSMSDFAEGRQTGLLPEDQAERIMLAVTRVNQCAMCAYGHSRWALEAGLSQQEVDHLLAGVQAGISQAQAASVLFAQHYADSRGKPACSAWQNLVQKEGRKKALAELGAMRMIMTGNALGIAAGSLKGRLQAGGKGDPRSSASYELGLLALLPFLGAGALLAAAGEKALGVPKLRCSRENR